MRFFVTYCAMDNQLANPLWHACLILSYWPGPGHKVEVINAWGFYAAPMANPNSFASRNKRRMGVAFDFKNNYGHLKIEEMRFLDLGYGLKGKTFAITFDQFMQLKNKCRYTMVQEDQAIAEAEASLLKQYKEKGLNIKPNSSDILHEEERLALERGVPSRLQRFELKVSLQLGFCTKLTMKNSNTCKTRAVSLLQDIGIDQQQLNELIHIQELPLFEKSMALPKYSGPMETIILHSTGPRKKHESARTGKCTQYREWGKGTKLFWSQLPQLIVADSPKEIEDLIFSKDLASSIKKIIEKLQRLEHVIVNTTCNKELEAQRSALIVNICDLYTKFADIYSKTPVSLIDERIANAESFLKYVGEATNRLAVSNKTYPYNDVLASLSGEEQNKICDMLGTQMPVESQRFAPR